MPATCAIGCRLAPAHDASRRARFISARPAAVAGGLLTSPRQRRPGTLREPAGVLALAGGARACDASEGHDVISATRVRFARTPPRRRATSVTCAVDASGGGGVGGVAGAGEGTAGSPQGSAELAEKLEGAGDKIAAYLSNALSNWEPPKFLWRTLYTLLLLGLVVKRVLWERKLNMQQTLQQIARVGPDTLGVAMLTSAFVGMVFTIQFCQEFSKVGLTRVIGGLLGLAFTRELTPVITAIVLAGRVGSAIAAELGTMQVSEQVDQLRTLGSDPVDYLVAPRVVACAVSLPILSMISFTIGMAASILLADLRYGISPNAIIDSAAKYLETSDIGVLCAKGLAFGGVIATISCGWGQTTTGGAKGVGESTTASVVISLVAIFVVDFALSLIFFNK